MVLSLRKKAMIEAMKEELGVVSRASKIVRVHRSTHYYWIKTCTEYKKEIEEANEENLDLAESALLEKIKKGNTRAIIFLLRTRGKDRGYF